MTPASKVDFSIENQALRCGKKFINNTYGAGVNNFFRIQQIAVQFMLIVYF